MHTCAFDSGTTPHSARIDLVMATASTAFRQPSQSAFNGRSTKRLDGAPIIRCVISPCGSASAKQRQRNDGRLAIELPAEAFPHRDDTVLNQPGLPAPSTTDDIRSIRSAASLPTERPKTRPPRLTIGLAARRALEAGTVLSQRFTPHVLRSTTCDGSLVGGIRFHEDALTIAIRRVADASAATYVER